jgi:arylformamidase
MSNLAIKPLWARVELRWTGPSGPRGFPGNEEPCSRKIEQAIPRRRAMSGITSGPQPERTSLEETSRRREEMVTATAAVRAAYPHELAVAYGPSPRHVLDLYLPAGEPVGPTIVFLHGGGFRVGETGAVGGHGLPYVAAGAIFIAMGYRLVPDARFPESAADVERGLVAVRDEVRLRGGDPGQIYLSGHSAGAMLAAQVGLRPSQDLDPELVRGLVLISGMYDFARQSEEVVDRSSCRYVADLCAGIERLPPHTITVAGAGDFPDARRDAVRLAEAIRARGGSVEHFVEPDADHFAANRSFVTPGGAVAEAAKAMMGLPAGVRPASRG